MIEHVRWNEALRDAIANAERCVLVVVAGCTGSTPREAGAAMLVRLRSVTGTIGGGHLEFEALRLAREALSSDAPCAQWLVRFPLAARLGQCCGGVATLCFAALDMGAHAWLDVVDGCVRSRTDCAIVGLIGPDAQASQRLIVTADDVRGSLGRPAVEALALREARARLHEGAVGASLIEAQGMTLFVHVVQTEPFDVAVFGNGHVGRALVQVLGALPARVRWIDTRDDDFPAQLPANVEKIATDDPVGEVHHAPRGAYLAVLTHSHALDFDIVTAALARDDLAYVGLIGSKSKRAQFERRWQLRGIDSEALRRLTCPIGAGALRGKEPGVIAVAIASELLAIRQSQAAHRSGKVVQMKRHARKALEPAGG
ncbi:MAG TPA: xanthine dehydrogenase accessory protein XdhC [Casimicrobiaceae bacterium]|nr:xanthine dehydrogenase accessory protein XdhC [Casimicrobiaceae bacterium]